MSASWLITDGLSGEANGVNKIVTMGLYSAVAVAVTAAIQKSRRAYARVRGRL